MGLKRGHMGSKWGFLAFSWFRPSHHSVYMSDFWDFGRKCQKWHFWHCGQNGVKEGRFWQFDVFLDVEKDRFWRLLTFFSQKCHFLHFRDFSCFLVCLTQRGHSSSCIHHGYFIHLTINDQNDENRKKGHFWCFSKVHKNGILDPCDIFVTQHRFWAAHSVW